MSNHSYQQRLATFADELSYNLSKSLLSKSLLAQQQLQLQQLQLKQAQIPFSSSTNTVAEEIEEELRYKHLLPSSKLKMMSEGENPWTSPLFSPSLAMTNSSSSSGSLLTSMLRLGDESEV